MDGNEEIRKAMEELEKVSGNEELRRMAELRLKGLRDERAAIAYAEEKGEKKKQIEIAKNMLKEDVNIEFIAKVTGLTEEEIKKI